MQRGVAIGGLLFVALIVVAVVSGHNWSTHIDPAKLVTDVHKNKAGLKVSAFAVGAAVLEGLAFFWYLREYLCDVEANRRLATLAFAGAIVFGVSGAVAAGVHLSMADAVDHADPSVLSTLNVLSNDLNTLLGIAGTGLLLLANGIAIIRNGPLPRWTGWVAVVMAVFSTVLGAIPVGVWLLVVCITILVRAGKTSPSPALP
jgi:hypothetical protein